MSIPADLKYSATHEWVRVESDGTVSIGITHHAQEQLGDIVFVEPPELGRKLDQGDECGVIESVKAAADLYSPVAGEVVAINRELETAPEKLNQEPYVAWLFRLRPDNAAELASLLDARAYGDIVAADAH